MIVVSEIEKFIFIYSLSFNDDHIFATAELYWWILHLETLSDNLYSTIALVIDQSVNG